MTKKILKLENRFWWLRERKVKDTAAHVSLNSVYSEEFPFDISYSSLA